MNKKEKRYYFDEMCSPVTDEKQFNKSTTLLIVIAFIIGIISAIIYGHITMNKFKYELSSYSYENIERLDNVYDILYDILIVKGSGYTLLDIPEYVASYKTEYDGDKIKLHYSLNYDENFDYAPSLYMDVTLSKDLKVIEKTKSYESEKEYIKSVKNSRNIFLVLIAIFFVPMSMLIAYIPTMYILMLISYIHKKIDLFIKSKRKTEG